MTEKLDGERLDGVVRHPWVDEIQCILIGTEEIAFGGCNSTLRSRYSGLSHVGNMRTIWVRRELLGRRQEHATNGFCKGRVPCPEAYNKMREKSK